MTTHERAHSDENVGCVDRSWRWAAVREDLSSSPRLLIGLFVGVGLVVPGIFLHDTAVGVTFVVTGLGMIEVFFLFPLASDLALGPGGFKFRPRQAQAEGAVDLLRKQYASELGEIAGEILRIPADSDEASACVSMALERSGADSGLVPREHQPTLLFCHLIDALSRVGPLPRRRSRGGNAAFKALSFDQRCALVLGHDRRFSAADCAHILHLTLDEFEMTLRTAQAALDEERRGEP